MDWAEELVVAGSSSGPIKLWDLEQAKGEHTFRTYTLDLLTSNDKSSVH